jgi:hypothetical protein
MKNNLIHHTNIKTCLPSFQINKISAPALVAIIGLTFVTIICFSLGYGNILNIAFPLGSFLVGLFLYWKYPVIYIGFSWWLWFLSPFIRRVVDYQSGYTDPSPILLAPYLVSFITIMTFWKQLSTIVEQKSFPFILPLYGLLYGFIVGLFNHSLVVVSIEFLRWSTPVFFGFHLFTNWKKYPAYKDIFESTFIWGVFITGAYGIFQYLIAPDWDTLWQINTDMTSIGNPEPLNIRVWSTMNSPGSFASFMAAGLLFLFCSKSNIRFPAMTVGYLAFLLSLARSAWGSWFIGLLILSFSFKGKQKIYLICTILFIILTVIVFINIDSFSDRITERLSTFFYLDQDHSANVRQQTYQDLLNQALFSVVGLGLGVSKYDSAILVTLFSLGWLGTGLYLSGILKAILELFRNLNQLEPFACASTAIAISYFTKIFLSVSTIEVSGMILWSCIALSLSSKKFYNYEKMRCRVS